MTKIIPLKNFQKSKKNPKMFFLVIVIAASLGLVAWNKYVEDIARIDVKIPQSKNITFNSARPIPMTTAQIANEFEKADGKPILLYIYTTWCKICTKNFTTINEISREFQNTDLQIITLALDRDMTEEGLQSYLGNFGDFYFQPHFLAYKEGFVDFLQKKNIRYTNHIPFTALISRDGNVITKFTRIKSQNFLRNKIIKELYGS